MLRSLENYAIYHIPIFSLVNLQKKISMGMNMLQYFSMRKWDFRSEKISEIRSNLSAEEKEIFYSYFEKTDVSEYMKNCILGGRQFCLKVSICLRVRIPLI
jgi:fatty acyl-CoA reductase